MLHSRPSPTERQVLAGRLLELWERTGDPALHRLAEGLPPRDGVAMPSEQSYSDWVSTSLMDCYKQTGESAVFALLYELNRASFLQAVQARLRRTYQHVDAQDVLQEVFLNIYRYPHRFHADRADAFRGWGHRIARNTLLKFLKGQSRVAQFRDLEDEVVQPEDLRGPRPDRAASDAESAVVVNHAYLLYLQLYLQHFGNLSPKERRALTLVEVDGVSYRDAAQDLGIRLENLKMVVFRGRRKIFRGMELSLGLLSQVEVGSNANGRTVDSPGADSLGSGSGAASSRRRGARHGRAAGPARPQVVSARVVPPQIGINPASMVTD